MAWRGGSTMPRIANIDRDEAMRRVRRGRPGADDRAPLREAIANLTTERMLELEPDEGETMRKLKLTVTRAVKEVNRAVGYGESESGTLLVWLEAKPRRRRRSRQGRTATSA
jgi:hypothetical protein